MAPTVIDSAPGTQGRAALTRQGLFLLISALVLTVSGFGFWWLAAREIDDQTLGRAAALTSLILFISGVTRLNLASSLPALLPGSGRSGRPILVRANAVASGIGATVALVVVIVSQVLGDGVVGLNGPVGFLIPLCVVAWTLFSIQDGALTATGGANLVAAENTTYSLIRLLAVGVAIAFGLSIGGMLLAWFIPLILFVPVVNLVVWRRLDHEPSPTWKPTAIGRFVASDFAGSVAVLASTRGFAYFALLALPAVEGADLAVVWLFFITVDVLFQQLSAALTVEATKQPEQASALARLAAVQATGLGVVGGAIGFALAPWILGLLLSSASDEAVLTLRLVFVALAARPVLHVWLAQARAQRRHRALLVGPIFALLMFVAGVVPGLIADDIVLVGVGVAASGWLVAAGFAISLAKTRDIHSAPAEALAGPIVRAATTSAGSLSC